MKFNIFVGTFKQQKFTLVKEGYDPAQSGKDDLYCIDMVSKTFQRLAAELFQKINSGEVRL